MCFHEEAVSKRLTRLTGAVGQKVWFERKALNDLVVVKRADEMVVVYCEY